MRYLALATDYDGTLADDGRVDQATLAAIQLLKESGRRVILVTGRELDDLRRVFPECALFDRIVAENGALVLNPATGEETVLGEAPPPALVRRLQELGVQPLSVGRVIVATWHPHEDTVLDVIQGLGMEHQVILNKGAVMVLPAGIDKAAGFRAALADLRVSPRDTVSVGDAENDQAFLAASGAAIAVANALPMLKERAAFVTTGSRGSGVVEIIERLLATDLRELSPTL